MERTTPPKQTLEIERIYKCIKSKLKRFGRHKSRKEAEKGGGLVKSSVVIFKSVFRQFFVVEAQVPRKAWSSSAGFSNPIELLLLERSQPLGVKAGLIEGAGTGGRPVFLSAIRALDDVVLGVGTCGGSVRGSFMVAGADSAPGRL